MASASRRAAPPDPPGNASCSRGHGRFRVAPSTLKYEAFGEGGRDVSNPHAGSGKPARLDCSWTDGRSAGDIDGIRAVADPTNADAAVAAGAADAARADSARLRERRRHGAE